MKDEKKKKGRNEETRKHNISNIRNAFVMVCVSVAMLSTATYAWFTVTSNPSVEGLELTAATKGGLEIAWSSSGEWKSSIDITDQPADQTKTTELTPVTVTEKTTPVFKEAISATGDTVTDSDLGEVPDSELYTNYVAKYTYYMRTAGGGAGTVKVGLTKNESSDKGCYIRRKDAHTAADKAEQAIRVGFKVGSRWVIYEPNSDNDSTSTNYLKHAAGTSFPLNDMVAKQDTAGSFTGGSDGNSAELFEVTGTATKIEMYVWIEGTDRSCVNGIMTDELEGRIQFCALN